MENQKTSVGFLDLLRPLTGNDSTLFLCLVLVTFFKPFFFHLLLGARHCGKHSHSEPT